MRRLFIIYLLIFPCWLWAQPNQQVKVTDLLNIKTVGNVSVSRDGSTAAFTVTSIEADEKGAGNYRYVSQIFRVGSDGSRAAEQLTFSTAGATQPAWSPDGKTLAFVRPVNGKTQVFLLSMRGGEAVQLTNAPYGASLPRWSPDGKQLLFVSAVPFNDLLVDTLLNPHRTTPRWPQEKPGYPASLNFPSAVHGNPDGTTEEIRSFLAADEAEGKAKVLNRLDFQNEYEVSDKQYFKQWFLIQAAPGQEARRVTYGFYNYTGASFTADGKGLIMEATIDSIQHPDRARESGIYLANLNGNSLHTLLSEKGVSYSNVVLSPSGKWIAFLYGQAGFLNTPALAIMPLRGSGKDMITLPFDRSKENIRWSSDERSLYFVSPSHGGAPLFRADLATKKVEQLTPDSAGLTSFDIERNTIIYALTQVSDPSALYQYSVVTRQSRTIGRFNGWLRNKRLSFPEKHTFTNNEGMAVDYWVMKPIGYKQGQRFPLLLEIHGGPSAMWGPGEASMWHEFQYFCSKGFGVIYCNPRGSGGYGDAFFRANIKDWGTGPMSDILTALDKTVAEGWTDTSKLFLTGGSYGGYMVAWIIAHDHRFAAACSQRGVYDLATFFGEGNAWRLVPEYFGGYPWDPQVRKLLTEQSPITYVQQITTPYIIFHGESDRRTGFVQGEMMYRSLKVLGRPVEYVRHPGATHEITRSGDNRQRIDQMLRTYEFFSRYF